MPTKLLFAVNVGRSKDGAYLASDNRRGAHWTLCFVDTMQKTIVYGDSLAWPVPDGLLERVYSFIQLVSKADGKAFTLVVCHDPYSLSARGGHCCGPQCAQLYPLQSCSSICGFVVVVMAAIACHHPTFFDQLSSVHSNPVKLPQLFLKAPSHFSGYIRRVVAAWFAEKKVNTGYVLPAMQIANDSSQCPTHVPETSADDNSHCPPGVSVTSAGDDSHYSPGVSVTSTGDDSHCPLGMPVTSADDDSHCPPGVPVTSAGDDSHCPPGVPVTSAGDDSHCPPGVPVTSAGDDSHCPPGVPVTSAGDDSHCPPGVPVTSAGDETHCPPGVPVTSADGDAHCSPNGNKRYKCNYCCSVFSRNSSLKRHMGRKHPSERIAHSGTCTMPALSI